jgi:hypothetical protein
MVMLPALAPTLFFAATPLAGDRQRPIPVVIEPCVRAPEGVLRRAWEPPGLAADPAPEPTEG